MPKPNWLIVNGGAGGGLQKITLDLKKTTVDTDVGDVTLLHTSSGGDITIVLIAAVLRVAISEDLEVAVSGWVTGTPNLITNVTVPASTAIKTPLSFTSFSRSTFPDLTPITWDVITGDGSVDSKGILTVHMWFQ